MTFAQALASILKALGTISILLMIGTFLRAKIPAFQKLYIPASVIGGFIGLIVGPNLLGVIPFSEDTMSIASALPNVLIIPVLAAVPMGIKFGGGGKKALLEKGNDMVVLSFLEAGMFIGQMALGCLITVICARLGAKAFSSMGLELAMGFSGGHGTAASLGSSFEQLGDPMWEVAQGGAMTTATAGMVGGILLGIILINYAARKGYTTQIKTAADTPKEMRVGLYSRDSQRPSMGPQTTVSNSIETLSLHIGLLFIAALGGYMLSSLAATTGISILTSLPTWLYGMIAMIVLWALICLFKLDYLFDDGVKNKITGLMSDYLITAAIMSIPVSVVATYWVVLLAVIVVGIILTPMVQWFVCKWTLRTNWFEKFLGMLGANTGVYVTGLLLIKMADPDLKSDALADYSVGYTIGSLVLTPIMAIIMVQAVEQGTSAALMLSAIATVVCFVGLFAVQKFVFGGKKKA